MFNTFADNAAGSWFTHKCSNSHTETTDHQSTTQPKSVINNSSFNSTDNLLQPNIEDEDGGWGRGMFIPLVLLHGRLGSFSPNPVSNRVCFTLEQAERHYSNGDKVGWQSLSPRRYVLLQNLNISPCSRRINKEINRRQAEEGEILALLHPPEDNKNNAFICCRASTLHQV